MTKPRIVILGCGFGGLATVNELTRHARGALDITAFNRTPVLYNYPMLPRLLFDDLPEHQLNWPLAELIDGRRARFQAERVTAVDFAGRRVHTDTQRLDFDYLVLAPGSKAIPLDQDDGVAVYYPKAARHLVRLRAEIDALCREGAAPGASHAIAVVGGGLTGVEFAAGIRALADRLCRAHRTDAARITVTLIEQAPRLAARCHPQLSAALSRQLARRGIRVLTGQRVERAHRDRVTTTHGELPARCVLCCIGSQADLRFAVQGIDNFTAARVAPTLQLRDQPRCFVIGDAATLVAAAHQETKRASHAMHQGRAVARNLLRLIAGKSAEAYRAPHHPTLVTLDDRSALLEYRGLCLAGRWPARLKHFLETRYL